ncbi:MAG: hypothetical protein ACRDZW_04165 [Acidimicrobiales bacterium]
MSTPSWTRSNSRARHDQSGVGVISGLAGAVVFLVFVLFAVQVLYGLYATSVVSAVTFDAARTVAGADRAGDAGAQSAAEAEARNRLGAYATDVAFTWKLDPDAVHLTVRARRPSFLPRSLATTVGLDDIVRTVRVRTERVR